jgi:hypothetical protein
VAGHRREVVPPGASPRVSTPRPTPGRTPAPSPEPRGFSSGGSTQSPDDPGRAERLRSRGAGSWPSEGQSALSTSSTSLRTLRGDAPAIHGIRPGHGGLPGVRQPQPGDGGHALPQGLCGRLSPATEVGRVVCRSRHDDAELDHAAVPHHVPRRAWAIRPPNRRTVHGRRTRRHRRPPASSRPQSCRSWSSRWAGSTSSGRCRRRTAH